MHGADSGLKAGLTTASWRGRRPGRNHQV